MAGNVGLRQEALVEHSNVKNLKNITNVQKIKNLKNAKLKACNHGIMRGYSKTVDFFISS